MQHSRENAMQAKIEYSADVFQCVSTLQYIAIIYMTVIHSTEQAAGVGGGFEVYNITNSSNSTSINHHTPNTLIALL